MTDITIPPEALEAAAKDLRTSRQGNTVAVDWNALSDEAKTYWISKARAEVERPQKERETIYANLRAERAETRKLRSALIHARNQMQHPDQLIDEALAQPAPQKEEET